MQTDKAKNTTRDEIVVGAIRSRIEATNQKRSSSEEISPADLEKAWARRSAQVAKKIQEEEQGEVVKAAIISLDNELYGLDVQYIFDIRALESITFVPRAPAWVLGVVNWRGRILSVINLRRFLGLPSKKDAETRAQTTQHLVVLQVGEMEVGIQADEVFLIELIPVSKIDTSYGVVRAIKPEFVNGLFIRSGLEAKNQLGIVLLLNLPALLSDHGLVIREEIL